MTDTGRSRGALVLHNSRPTSVANVINPVDEGVARTIADASGPATDQELAGEPMLRTLFDATAATWKTERRAPRRKALGVAAASLVGMVGATAGLAAASVLPPPAAHVVDGMLGHLHLYSKPSPRTADSGAVGGSSPSADASSQAAEVRPSVTSVPVQGRTPTSCRARSSTTGEIVSSCSHRHNKIQGVDIKSSSSSNTTSRSGSNKESGTTASQASGGSGSSSTGAGSGSGSGNSGTGAGSGSGTGTGTGTGSGNGTGGSGSGQGGGRGGNGGVGGGSGGHHGGRHKGDGGTTTTTTSTTTSTTTTSTTLVNGE